MMKSKKIVFAAILAVMISSVAVLFNAVFAADESVSLTNNDYALSEKYEVSLVFDQGGELKTAKNGLRLKAVISANDYEGLKNSGEQTVIKYGMLFAPKSYVTDNALTAESVFGADRAYATNAAQAAEDEANGKETLLIDCVESEDLIKVGDDYVLYLTVSDFDSDGLLKEYTAKAYMVKYTVDENRMVTAAEYNFLDGAKEINMVYAVQKAIEDGKVGSYAEDLQSAYIDGKKQNVTVEYITSYSGLNPVSNTVEMSFDVGATVTKQDILDRFTSLDQAAYDLSTDFVSQKIYAGKTPKVVLNFGAKQAESKNPAIGMYISDEINVKIKQNALTYGETTYNDYLLFRDGTIAVGEEGSRFILGKVDFAKKQFAADGKTCSQVIELDENAYAKAAGMYMFDGKFVRIAADGTAEFDLMGSLETVNYLLAYDEANDKFVAAFSNSVVKEFDEENCTIADFNKASLADAAAYTNAAGYYSCLTEGANFGKIFRFNVDGTVYSDNVKVGAFMLLSDGTLTANIGGSVFSAKIATSTSDYGVINKTMELKTADDSVVMSLRNQSMANYDEATKQVNNLFGKSELQLIGTVAGTRDGIGKPVVLLTTAPCENDDLAAITLADGTHKWKQAEYGTSGWGYFAGYQDKNNTPNWGLAWFAEQTSPTGGIIHFRRNADGGEDKSKFDNKLVRYEITEDNKLALDMTDYDPHGFGDATQFQVLYADINPDECRFTTTAKSIYDVFGSEYGSHYLTTLYTQAGKVDQPRTYKSGIVLYNYPTTMAGYDGYYTCEYWENKTGMINNDFTKDRIAYKIEYDYEKNVGALIIKGQSDKKYTIGIINGVRYIDMRDPINGWDEWGDIKVSDISEFVKNSKGIYENYQVVIDAIYPTIEYSISTANQTFVNAGGAVEQPEDTRTIYEKIAGSYKTRNYYHETSNWWWGIGIELYADGRMYVGAEGGKYNTYTLTEITDTFGEIRVIYGGKETGYDLTGNCVGYYSLINGQYVLRLTVKAQFTSDYTFWDLTPDGCSFSTWDVFDALIDDGSKTYSDGEATLTLNAPGNKKYEDGTRYEGAKFTLVDGETTLSANYDLVPTAVGAGKILFSSVNYYGDTGIPLGTLIATGDYKLVGENYVIAITVNGKSYMFTVDGADAVKAELCGEYYGTKNVTFTSAAKVTFTSISTGTITENGITASFVFENGKVKLTFEDDGLDYVAVK